MTGLMALGTGHRPAKTGWGWTGDATLFQEQFSLKKKSPVHKRILDFTKAFCLSSFWEFVFERSVHSGQWQPRVRVRPHAPTGDAPRCSRPVPLIFAGSLHGLYQNFPFSRKPPVSLGWDCLQKGSGREELFGILFPTACPESIMDT